jgi:hypothetical protein
MSVKVASVESKFPITKSQSLDPSRALKGPAASQPPSPSLRALPTARPLPPHLPPHPPFFFSRTKRGGGTAAESQRNRFVGEGSMPVSREGNGSRRGLGHRPAGWSARAWRRCPGPGRPGARASFNGGYATMRGPVPNRLRGRAGDGVGRGSIAPASAPAPKSPAPRIAWRPPWRVGAVLTAASLICRSRNGVSILRLQDIGCLAGHAGSV